MMFIKICIKRLFRIAVVICSTESTLATRLETISASIYIKIKSINIYTPKSS